MANSRSNVQDFLDGFMSDGARPCNFFVDIYVPTLFSPKVAVNTRKLSFRCEAAELPSRTFSLVDQKTYGPIEQYPIQNAFDKINLTFLCSDNLEEKIFFDNWMDYISPSKSEYAPDGWFNFKYKSDYATKIEINQVDNTNVTTSYRATLVDAFPVSTNQLGLDWSNVNTIHRLVVTFAYRYCLNPSRVKFYK